MGIDTLKKSTYKNFKKQAELESEIRGLKFRGDTIGKAVNANGVYVIETY